MIKNKAEAAQILDRELSRYRSFAWKELADRIDRTEELTVKNNSGMPYEIGISVGWSDASKTNIIVFASIDDGQKPLFPLSWRIERAPDGSIVKDICDV